MHSDKSGSRTRQYTETGTRAQVLTLDVMLLLPLETLARPILCGDSGPTASSNSRPNFGGEPTRGSAYATPAANATQTSRRRTTFMADFFCFLLQNGTRGSNLNRHIPRPTADRATKNRGGYGKTNANGTGRARRPTGKRRLTAVAVCVRRGTRRKSKRRRSDDCLRRPRTNESVLLVHGCCVPRPSGLAHRHDVVADERRS